MTCSTALNLRRRLVLTAFGGLLVAAMIPVGSAHADPDAPTPIGPETDTGHLDISPFEDSTFGNQDFTLDGDAFDGSVRDTNYFGATDYLIDINNPGELAGQYNDFSIGDFSEIYSNIGGTPEAAFDTPFGDFSVPTSWVQDLGPSFFEPFGLADGPIPVAVDAASLVDPSALDVSSLFDIGSLLP